MKEHEIIKDFIYSNEVSVAPGVTQYKCAFYDIEDKRIEASVVYVDLKCPTLSISTALPDNGDKWGMQRTTDMAKAACRNGQVVVGAVNGDFYNMTTGEPEGVFIKNGIIIKDTMYVGKNFFGITKGGIPVIGNDVLFNNIKGDLQTAVGGRSWLVKDSRLNNEEIDHEIVRHPRTAIGIKNDGTVFFTVVDGRQPGFSEGINLPMLARFMINLGAVNALNIDGGGSSTFAIRIPGTNEFKMVNSTSDGEERTTANSVLIISSAQENHQFANAHIEPFGKVLAPGGFVCFKAMGRDASGAPAPLPLSALSWSLSSQDFGTIDSNGYFVSNNTEGKVEILLKLEDEIVGKTVLELITPEQLFFDAGGEFVIPSDTKKTLKLFGKYKGRKIDVQNHQIDWIVPLEVGYVDENGEFCASSNSGEGIIQAKLRGTDVTCNIQARVGQLPIVLYEFESIDELDTWYSSTSGKGEIANLGQAYYTEEPVWLGERSLRINFDFSMGKKESILGVYGGPVKGQSVNIPYKPQAIGMWVYGTEEAKGLWLRGKLYDAENSIINLDYTPKDPGIDWIGWRYVEAKAPEHFKAPFTFYQGEAIRIMSLKSDLENSKAVGTVYVDNIRAVYGERNDDPKGPEVYKISGAGQTFEEDSVYIVGWFRKKTDYKYATGLDYNRIRIFVDGKEYTNLKGHYGINKGNNTVMLSGIKFKVGKHKVKVFVKDKFGNEGVMEDYFTVTSKGGFSLMKNVKGHITMMTYNIHAGIGTDNKLDIERISKLIEENGAEIIGLNEVDCSTRRSQGINEVQSIAEYLGYHYYFGKTIDYMGGEYGNALVSKYPIISAESYILPDTGTEIQEARGIVKCILDVKGRKVNVLVTHLGLKSSERKVEIEYISNILKQCHGEIILMGDFNISQASQSEELEPFMKQMKDSTAELNEIEKLDTFDSVNPVIKIDYIMVSKDVQVICNKTINSIASDHLPFCSVLKLK